MRGMKHVHYLATNALGDLLNLPENSPVHVWTKLLAANAGQSLDLGTELSGDALFLPSGDGCLLPPKSGGKLV